MSEAGGGGNSGGRNGGGDRNDEPSRDEPGDAEGKDPGPRHLARPADGGRRGRAVRPPTGGPPTGRLAAVPRWAAPAVLAALTLVAGGGALALAGDDPAAALADDAARAPATPVLSARRVPDLVAEPVAERRLATELQAWLAASPPDTCLVVEDQGETVFAHNATLPVTGASTQKLLTATALVLALGPDARLETTAVAEAAPEGGVVAGDLYVVGGGDAMLATTAWRDHFTRQGHSITDIDALARAIADAGVTRIDGSVVGDGSRYDGATYHPAWPQRFASQHAVGPIGGLTVNDGFASFSSPGAPGIPQARAGDPAADTARVLTDLLRLHGVTVTGAARSGTAPEDAHEIAALPSATVADVVAEMLQESDNEIAEASFKEVGLATSGEGTWAAGAAGARDLLSEAGIDLEGVTIEDGSGLSIGNRFTCGTLVDVLTQPETGPVVRQGLAVAAESGTLAEQWRGTPVAGHLRGKTGTLRNATALAGEVDLTQGGTVTFAYVANVPDPGEVNQFQVGMATLPELLMAYPHDVDLAQLEPLPPG